MIGTLLLAAVLWLIAVATPEDTLGGVGAVVAGVVVGIGLLLLAVTLLIGPGLALSYLWR